MLECASSKAPRRDGVTRLGVWVGGETVGVLHSTERDSTLREMPTRVSTRNSTLRSRQASLYSRDGSNESWVMCVLGEGEGAERRKDQKYIRDTSWSQRSVFEEKTRRQIYILCSVRSPGNFPAWAISLDSPSADSEPYSHAFALR